MIIEIDTQQINELNISTDQFLFIKSLSNQVKGIKSFVNNRISDNDVVDLINKNILTNNSTKQNAQLTSMFIDTLFNEFNKNYFEVFFEIYPTCVTRPDGSKDYLRVNLQRCKKLYTSIIGDDKNKHDHIIKCLQYEIEQKRKTNKMGYFKKMSNWLSGEQWTESEEAMNDKKSTVNINIYGTDIQ